ncbi:UxaA family hydrolase [Halocynthiibacter sp. C4]|uniref:UxaA family hydrolase n=1 Tax=Halocynthiibacter sp. C4 TaxID=2992758 RepID=UPI00237B71D5|nr:UxaA family hydrolase [Halocynthiibacter sp. C4]MDE0591550.1 UxaA family hydrolase [Halocynthiibacter sp. C4]
MAQDNFLRLHDSDNVLVALRGVPKGTEVADSGKTFTTAQEVSLAHKIAAKDIAEGEIITKYGMPIGTATKAIAAGENVHVHNVTSNYTATVYRAEESGVSKDAV